MSKEPELINLFNFMHALCSTCSIEFIQIYVMVDLKTENIFQTITNKIVKRPFVLYGINVKRLICIQCITVLLILFSVTKVYNDKLSEIYRPGTVRTIVPRSYSKVHIRSGQFKNRKKKKLTECSFSRRLNSADFILDAVDIDGAFVISLSISLSQRLSLRGSPTKLCVRVDGPID